MCRVSDFVKTYLRACSNLIREKKKLFQRKHEHKMAYDDWCKSRNFDYEKGEDHIKQREKMLALEAENAK